MSVSRQAGHSDPRANQKARTRSAIVEAATRLMREGRPPSVAEAAEEAKVSRATAYRYFPSEEALRIEVAQLNPATAPLDALLAQSVSENPDKRLAEIIERFTGIVFAEEISMRSALRVQLDTWFEAQKSGGAAPLVREGRRMRWLDDILSPLKGKIDHSKWLRLRAALALTLGIDAIVVMKDVCHLTDEAEIADVLRWAALALLRAGVDGGV